MRFPPLWRPPRSARRRRANKGVVGRRAVARENVRKSLRSSACLREKRGPSSDETGAEAIRSFAFIARGNRAAHVCPAVARVEKRKLRAPSAYLSDYIRRGGRARTFKKVPRPLARRGTQFARHCAVRDFVRAHATCLPGLRSDFLCARKTESNEAI